LGGFLFRCGSSGPDVELFAEAVTIASGQPREKVKDVRKAAREAWDEASRPGGKARGFPALAETFGDDVAKHVAKWLGFSGERCNARGNGEAQSDTTYQPAGEPWPDPTPLPDGLLPVATFEPEFPARRNRTVGYGIADRMQCPLDYVGVAAIAALGSVLGRKIGVRPKQHDDWTCVPNFWSMIVGQPGAMKSPAIELSWRRCAISKAAAFPDAKMHFDNETKIFKLMEEDAKKKARQSKTGLRQTYEESRPVDKPAEPKQRRYLTSDTGYEKLGIMLGDNPNGLMLHRDELISLLRHLDKEEQVSAKAFFMTAWNGNVWPSRARRAGSP
jgi:Protein of unknown function (DUF3987)